MDSRYVLHSIDQKQESRLCKRKKLMIKKTRICCEPFDFSGGYPDSDRRDRPDIHRDALALLSYQPLNIFSTFFLFDI